MRVKDFVTDAEADVDDVEEVVDVKGMYCVVCEANRVISSLS